MNTAKFVACAIVCLASACGGLGTDVREETGVIDSALRTSVVVSTDDDDYWCATVKVRNNIPDTTTATWSVVITMNGTVFDNGNSGATYNTNNPDTTIAEPNGNANIPYGSSAQFTFCVTRDSKDQKPTVAPGPTSDCPTWYRDADGDGYVNLNDKQSSCLANLAGYLKDSSKVDCCDSDDKVHPGQNEFFTAANGCGNFDYNCDGTATKQSNGPTDCYDAEFSCENQAGVCVQTFPQPLPADCNGKTANYGQAECGKSWLYSVRGCTNGGACMGWSSGGYRGPQACQ